MTNHRRLTSKTDGVRLKAIGVDGQTNPRARETTRYGEPDLRTNGSLPLRGFLEDIHICPDRDRGMKDP